MRHAAGMCVHGCCWHAPCWADGVGHARLAPFPCQAVRDIHHHVYVPYVYVVTGITLSQSAEGPAAPPGHHCMPVVVMVVLVTGV